MSHAQLVILIEPCLNLRCVSKMIIVLEVAWNDEKPELELSLICSSISNGVNYRAHDS